MASMFLPSLVQVRVGQEHQLHVLARRGVGGKAGLLQLGHQQHFLDAAAGHADLLALQVFHGLDVAALPGHQARAALGKAGHHIDRRIAGAAGNGRFRRRGADVDLAGDDRLHHVQALGEDALLDLDAALGRDFLDVRDRAVVRELEIAESDDLLGLDTARGQQGGDDDGFTERFCGHCCLRYVLL
jgi:hypothetical protein